MTAHDTYIQAPYADDDSAASEAKRDREAEAIRDDPEQLLEAVYETDCDEAEKLAELRITLSKAAPALDRLFHGDLFGDVTLIKANMDALRDLVRAADNASALVTERVNQAAEITA